ncbi:MAG: sulfate adenylyltransferase [Desulfurococcales archaeon]|nr:sulfate adenylyltransferase [Desulfurococcales archaeon]MCE4622062.1 sulfate adenylyltransferase [Desulfurococcales archaeon]MCE4629970.1 sulfate adenylyltransferase [Desulfurococcales archaeon]
MVNRPHGGRLVNRVVKGRRKEALLEEALEIPRISISYERVIDLLDIAHGAFSPLEGFLVQEDYLHVLHDMRLHDDTPWTIPIILDVDPDEIVGLKEGDDIALFYDDKPIALMKIEEVYGWDKKIHSQLVYKTTDVNHPGVAKTMERKELLIGGRIDLLNDPPNRFSDIVLWPIETRVLFREKGWRTIAAFQTRNVPHRGHEYVQKAALTFTDGLLIHPLLGWKKKGDYKDEVIIRAYKALIEHYYPKNVVVLTGLMMNMHYAGPREAIHHAIVRKNFGATHFIVGRDHAGVGNYYGPYEAWELFNEFPDLGITPLFIREAFYCRKCGGMVTEKTCPHTDQDRLKISGTRIRAMLRKGEIPPEHMMRPEVAKVIIEFENPFVE